MSGWRAWPFAIVQLVGVWVIARATAAIDALELAGIRNTKITDEELQSRGAYGLVRHPIYLGWVLVVFGTAHMTGDRLAFAVLTTTYLLLAMPWEERSLERQFGPAYRRYKERVRWKIIPYLY
jgi:protein-S-isoprenylcysteine O-methyltransferase Ste14